MKILPESSPKRGFERTFGITKIKIETKPTGIVTGVEREGQCRNTNDIKWPRTAEKTELMEEVPISHDKSPGQF